MRRKPLTPASRSHRCLFHKRRCSELPKRGEGAARPPRDGSVSQTGPRSHRNQTDWLARTQWSVPQSSRFGSLVCCSGWRVPLGGTPAQ